MYIAVGIYETSDDGALWYPSQIAPSINDDGNIDAAEYLLVDLGALAGNDCPADLDGGGSIGLADLQILLAYYGQTGVTPEQGDLDDDGDVDLADLQALLADYGTTCN